MKTKIILFSDSLQIEFIDMVFKNHEIDTLIYSNNNGIEIMPIKNKYSIKIKKYDNNINYDFTGCICILFLFKKIIDVEKIKSEGIYNFHFGILPKWRGNSCNVWSLLNGDNKIGYSFHVVNEKVDDGDIVHQHILELKDEEKYFDFRNLILNKSINDASNIISNLESIKKIPNTIISPFYTPQTKKSDSILKSFDIPFKYFYGMYRAFSGSDWGFTVITSIGEIKILSIKVFNDQKKIGGFIGRVVNKIKIGDNLYTVIKVADGYVHIGEIIYKNKKIVFSDIIKIGIQL